MCSSDLFRYRACRSKENFARGERMRNGELDSEIFLGAASPISEGCAASECYRYLDIDTISMVTSAALRATGTRIPRSYIDFREGKLQSRIAFLARVEALSARPDYGL